MASFSKNTVVPITILLSIIVVVIAVFVSLEFATFYCKSTVYSQFDYKNMMALYFSVYT